MFNIEQLNGQTFKDQQLLAKIEAQAVEFIDHFMAPEGYNMARELEQKLLALDAQRAIQPQTFNRYWRLLIRLKFLSLHIWDNETFFDLIKNNLADILDSELNTNDRMTAKVYMFPALAWPEIAQQTIEVLRQNNQVVGNRQIQVQGEPATRPPLIKYWILDYDRFLGIDKHTNLERSQYFIKNRNYQVLSESDKIKVRELFEFYDGLKPLPLPKEVLPQETEEEEKPLIAIPRQQLEDYGYFQRQEEMMPEPESRPDPPPPQRPQQRPASGFERIGPLLPGQRTQSPPPGRRGDSYREPVSDQDLAGPQAAKKPTPKLDGNIVNLKDTNKTD